MKKAVSFLLVVLGLELLATGNVCLSQTRKAPDCCPPAEQQQAPRPSSLPVCCLFFVVRDHDSTAEVVARSESLRPPAALARLRFDAPWLVAASRPVVREIVSNPMSPPLDPLLQTCQLLI